MQQAPDTFDIEEGFLQQDQLRLHGQFMAARHLEQFHHDFRQ